MDIQSAESTLTRSQMHTLRERVNVIERRLHDIETAQEMGACRSDIHGDSIANIKASVEAIIKDLNGENRGP